LFSFCRGRPPCLPFPNAQISLVCFTALLLCLPPPLTAQPDLSALDFAAGKALFERTWVPAPASTRSADGLGPHYAARSCAACHANAGRGQAPAAFSLHLNDPVYGQRLLSLSTAAVPAEVRIEWLPEDSSAGQPLSPAWRFKLNGLTQGEPSSPISLRVAPSLRGLQWLQVVPRLTLDALADPDDRDGDGISGRLALLPSGYVGRFGWKAAVPSLQLQLQTALALDLGLSNSAFPEPWGDCTAAQSECRAQALVSADAAAPLEVDATATGLLLSYLSQLPPPAPLPRTEEGEALLRELGCAACHVPALASSLGEVKAYSDLLLHDLGPGLDDGLREGAAQPSEWRTAPLWALPPEGPFLHDGRARTLDEAVAWHGGEAQRSRHLYQELDAERKALLSAFLLGL
jgi:CxxC motif-containing protein (DUF1111 family)